jgi:hypothetical protein
MREGPLGVGVQAQALNHRKLLPLRAVSDRAILGLLALISMLTRFA